MSARALQLSIVAVLALAAVPVTAVAQTTTAPPTQTKAPVTQPKTAAAPPTTQTKTPVTQQKTAAPPTQTKAPVTQQKTAAPPPTTQGRGNPPAGQAKAATPPAPQTKVATPPPGQTKAPAPTGGRGAVPTAPRDSVVPTTIMREVFDYSRDGRRDPFISLLATTDLRPTLRDLKLLMTVVDEPGRSVALVQDAYEKKQKTLRVGTRLGRMRVSSIRSDMVMFTIEEFGMNRRDSLLLRDSTKVRGR